MLSAPGLHPETVFGTLPGPPPRFSGALCLEDVVLLPMLVLTVVGVALLAGAPLLARYILRPDQDPVGMTRMLQALAVVLLIGALLIRPRNLETTAVPPPPDLAPATTND
ncbi:MAG: hypothetical protein GEU90_04420 [Gemmatimonas sp.]|nr:hypothetical protein [Gemmatimonas sp.]